jgi:hypothetical protein
MVLLSEFESEIFALSGQHVNQLHHRSKMDSSALLLFRLSVLRYYPEIKLVDFIFYFQYRKNLIFAVTRYGCGGWFRTNDLDVMSVAR